MIELLTRQAAKAAKLLANTSSQTRVELLLAMANAIKANAKPILQANQNDMNNAQQAGLSEAMLDRLLLTEQRLVEMADGMEMVAHLDEVLGLTTKAWQQPNGLKVSKYTVPLGVICMIYEARPNVTADASALAIKSGNAIILRGGKEALNSSLAIADVLQQVITDFNLPKEIVTVVPNPDRALLLELLQQKDHIELVIPRGGEGLINFVDQHSQIPVIKHYKGVCHLYVDQSADFEQALNILINGKTQRTGVCNALEGLVVHADIAKHFLPIVNKVLGDKSVTFDGCRRAQPYFEQFNVLNDDEFGQEYLSKRLAIKVVDDFEAALDHIDRFGSHHTEVICTTNADTAKAFQHRVDASVVMVNASSRFSDGGQLGLGAEIGIATTKLHAYGPMGIESLVTEKYLVNGEGQVRS
jgi:glutamate-5-semialdehyde dehydrogenase